MKTMLTFALAVVAGMCFAGEDCCKKKVSADEAFLQEANRMMASAEGAKACCKTTATKVVVKGEKGCCNAPAEPKPFKVFVANKGYEYFGCEGSAKEGRAALVAKGHRVGKVQKATVQR
jgi:hypothetical protein